MSQSQESANQSLAKQNGVDFLLFFSPSLVNNCYKRAQITCLNCRNEFVNHFVKNIKDRKMMRRWGRGNGANRRFITKLRPKHRETEAFLIGIVCGGHFVDIWLIWGKQERNFTILNFGKKKQIQSIKVYRTLKENEQSHLPWQTSKCHALLIWTQTLCWRLKG